MSNTYVQINGQTVDISSVQIPTSRHFRNAWTLDANVVGVDMARAREIQKNILRQERLSIFQTLDAEFMKALERGDTAKQTEIATKKQQLRDVTDHPDIDNAATPEVLETLTLSLLVP
jgi:hypothetical protein